MTLFESLFLAHLLGDWVLQTEWQALNKTREWRALLMHLAVYHAIMLAVLLTRFSFTDARVWIAIIFLAATHAVLDRRTFTINLLKAFRGIVQREPESWLVLAVDQSLHLLAIGSAVLGITL